MTRGLIREREVGPRLPGLGRSDRASVELSRLSHVLTPL